MLFVSWKYLQNFLENNARIAYEKIPKRTIMQKIITTLTNALKHPDKFMESLADDDTFFYKKEYPVAVVHHEKRINHTNVAACLHEEGFLSTDGMTPEVYSDAMLKTFESCAPQYVKNVSLMCFSSTPKEGYAFKEKRSGDYWKKVVNPGNFKAVIEYAEYHADEDICKIEFDLRERMRSSKEVPQIKVLPFIWIVRLSTHVDIAKIMQHYYGDNFEIMAHANENIAIGWSTTLREVNMRYFVCPPNPDEKG